MILVAGGTGTLGARLVRQLAQSGRKVRVLARDPSAREFALANDYLATGTMADYAHALLCTNEVIFWP